MSGTGVLSAAVLIVVGVWPLLPTKAQSGDWGDGHAEMHSIYQSWHNRENYSCCNNSDCRPTRAYKDDDGRWRVLADGQWVIVPPYAILDIASPDGRSHVCMAKGAVEPRCVVLGEPRI